MSGLHVLVSGATGFLGSEVARGLVARGATVHALRREHSDVAALEGRPLVWHRADLEEPGSLARAFTAAATAARGAHAALDVVHLAAGISYRRADRERLQRVNVEGTRHLLALARAHGVRRVCHVSSVVALGPVACADQVLTDEAPLRGGELDSAYAATKAAAEELALSAARELDVVVASPAVVFGCSQAASNSRHFVARAVRGRLGPLCPPGSLSVVGLADAARGIELVLARGARGQRYLLAESAWRLQELLGLACRLAGRRAPRLVVPPRPWRALVALARQFERIVPSERATSEALGLLGLHFRFEARRARAELGWSPRPFPEVLAEVVAEVRARP